jgi:hypothetical protein
VPGDGSTWWRAWVSDRVTLWRAQIVGNADRSRRDIFSDLTGRAVRESLSATAARITALGLPDTAGPMWGFADLFGRREELRRNPKLYSDPSVGQVQGFFATADRDTAHWYAGREGSESAIVVEFEAPLDTVIVDCRDFLDRVFLFAESFLEKGEAQRLGPMRECIRKYWGAAVLEYFDALGSGGTVIELVNSAAYDIRVVRAHLANSVVLQGRSGVTFRNQLAVLAPVGPEHIRRIEPPAAVTMVPSERLAPLIFGS